VKSEGSAGESFDEIFLRHYSRIVAILRRMVGDHGRAEELASEVFLKLYRQPLPQDAGGSVGGWLYRTATNLGIDALRSAARRNRFETAAAQDASQNKVTENGFDRTLLAERQQRVRRVLADLKPEQAQLLLLRASGHSYKELAAALDIEPGSVGTFLIRAEAAFEQHYRKLFGGEEDV
jgi:RNA polymerase sigma-70 factor (ECF subfamily)